VSTSDVQLVREGLDALAEFATYKQSSERVAECKVALDRLEAHGEGFRAEAAEQERDGWKEAARRRTEAWAEECAIAERRAEVAEARVRELEAALREIEPWIIVPSDTYPQHHEALGRARDIARAALKQAEGQR